MPGQSVLVVDDFADGREMLVTYLRFRGFTVFEATGGSEAIAAAKRHKPSVILMDLRMPGVDGWQATRTLKAGQETREILIVALTAHALPAEVASALQAGCDAVIPKPFDLTSLANAIDRSRTVGAAAFGIAPPVPSRGSRSSPTGKSGRKRR